MLIRATESAAGVITAALGAMKIMIAIVALIALAFGSGFRGLRKGARSFLPSC
jgi:hypothetical protein